MATNFWKLCGNPDGAEMQIEHLEDHMGHVTLGNRAAEERERSRQVKEKEICEKVAKLNLLVRQHAKKFDGVSQLKEAIDANTMRLDQTDKRVTEFVQEAKDTRAYFNRFVQKSEAAMQTQTDASQATKVQLELLTQHLNAKKRSTECHLRTKSRENGPAQWSNRCRWPSATRAESGRTCE